MNQHTAAFVHYVGQDRYEVMVEHAARFIAEAGICAIPGCDEVTAVFETKLPICIAHAAQINRDYVRWWQETARSPYSRIVVDDFNEPFDDETYSPAQQSEQFRQSMADARRLIEVVREGAISKRDAPRPKQDTPAVYYVRMTNHIKIGYTTDLKARMKTFCVHLDALLAVEPGGHERETERHHQFAHLREGRSELFRDSADLLDHIAVVRQTFGDPLQFL